MDLNVQTLMLRFLETQKGYVREDLHEYSEAMVAVFPAKGNHYLRFPKFQDEKTKIEVYRKIVDEAKAEKAILIVTVNQAFLNRSWTPEEMEIYRWGDFDTSNADLCISITGSGSGVRSCGLSLTYKIIDDEVLFGEPEWLFDIEVGMLPDWPHDDSVSHDKPAIH